MLYIYGVCTYLYDRVFGTRAGVTSIGGHAEGWLVDFRPPYHFEGVRQIVLCEGRGAILRGVYMCIFTPGPSFPYIEIPPNSSLH